MWKWGDWLICCVWWICVSGVEWWGNDIMKCLWWTRRVGRRGFKTNWRIRRRGWNVNGICDVMSCLWGWLKSVDGWVCGCIWEGWGMWWSWRRMRAIDARFTRRRRRDRGWILMMGIWFGRCIECLNCCGWCWKCRKCGWRCCICDSWRFYKRSFRRRSRR